MKYLWIVVVGIILVAGTVWYLGSKPTQDRPTEEGNEGIACTMEAKMCPDGSYVGRSGPNCEFSPCP